MLVRWAVLDENEIRLARCKVIARRRPSNRLRAQLIVEISALSRQTRSNISQWLLENYRCGARRPRGRVHTVSSDQDHRRGESLGKPILINPRPLLGAVERLV
jgi:hypothetical protein